jgi:hypothetical protein
MRVATRGGHGNGVKSGLFVVKVALRLLEAGVGGFRLGAAVLPLSQNLPATVGLARHAVGTVLDEEVLVVFKGTDVPPELDLVDIVGSEVDVGGGEVEDGTRRHLVVVDQP